MRISCYSLFICAILAVAGCNTTNSPDEGSSENEMEERQIVITLSNTVLQTAADGVAVQIFNSSDSLLADGEIMGGTFDFAIVILENSMLTFTAEFTGFGYKNFNESFNNTGPGNYDLSMNPAPIKIVSSMQSLKPGGSHMIDLRDYIESTDPDDGKPIQLTNATAGNPSTNLKVDKVQEFVYELTVLNNVADTQESVLLIAGTYFNESSKTVAVPVQPGPMHYVIMPLGDSYTNDSRSRVRLWNLLTAEDHTVNYVGDQYQESSIPESYHEGVGGLKIQGVMNKAGQLMTSHKPQYINLMIGTNDIAWYFDETGPEIAGRWDNLVQELIDHAPSGTWIVAAPIPPVTSKIGGKYNMDEKDRAVIVKSFNAAIRKHVQDRINAGDNIILADMEAALTVEDHVSSDGVHLNKEGYHVMGTIYYDTITSIRK